MLRSTTAARSRPYSLTNPHLQTSQFPSVPLALFADERNRSIPALLPLVRPSTIPIPNVIRHDTIFPAAAGVEQCIRSTITRGWNFGVRWLVMYRCGSDRSVSLCVCVAFWLGHFGCSNMCHVPGRCVWWECFSSEGMRTAIAYEG